MSLSILRLRAGDRVFRRRPRLIVTRMASWCAPKPRRFSPSASPWPSVHGSAGPAGDRFRARGDSAGRRLVQAPATKTVLPGRFPLFILERGPNDVVYGFPDFEQRGVKAAPYNHGPQVSADDWDPSATDAELLPVSEVLAELVPGAAGPIVDRDICLYTNTLPSDRRPDKREEFIVDRWPNSRLIVASPCSGHGAKFAPGEDFRLTPSP
jgi:hypothetical protein